LYAFRQDKYIMQAYILMTSETLKKYDIIELQEDLNPKLKKGMRGTILEKFNEENFEIEIVDMEGQNIDFDNQFTFTVSRNQIKRIE
jgi:hypothetical protein